MFFRARDWLNAESAFLLADAQATTRQPDAFELTAVSPGEFGETPFAGAPWRFPALGRKLPARGRARSRANASRQASPCRRTSGATGRDEEHGDSHATGLPLLATGPSTHLKHLSTHFTVRELVALLRVSRDVTC